MLRVLLSISGTGQVWRMHIPQERSAYAVMQQLLQQQAAARVTGLQATSAPSSGVEVTLQCPGCLQDEASV